MVSRFLGSVFLGESIIGEKAKEMKRMIVDRLVTWIAAFRRRSFMRVIQQTLSVLFPFVLLGSLAQVIAQSCLTRQGFFNYLLRIDRWLPHFQAVYYSFDNFAGLTVGIVALLAAYQSARYTAKLYRRDSAAAGLTALIAFLLLSSRYMKAAVEGLDSRFLGFGGLLLGLIIGYVVGQIFRLCGRPLQRESRIDSVTIIKRTFDSFWAILVALGGAFLLNKLLILILFYNWSTSISLAVAGSVNRHHGLGMTLVFSAFTALCAWFGANGPYSSMAPSNGYTVNLNAALVHHSSWNVPYKYCDYSLYHAFASVGGTGATLALLIAIALVARQRANHRVARWTVLPTLLNSNSAVMMGIPLLFNPVFLIPMVGVPLLNVLLAAGAVFVHLIPPVVYPVPTGTPGLLVAFIGSNGNWMTLVVTAVVLVVDVACYIPFVRLAERVTARMAVQERRREHHAD